MPSLTLADMNLRTMAKKKVFRKEKLTAKERQAMPKSDFALPGKGEGPKGAGAGSYPIDTKARARNALARGAQNASPADRAQIKRKVEAKYPSIAMGGKKKPSVLHDHPRSKSK